MALKVDRTVTYERTLVDPEDGAEYNVKYRKLDNGEVEASRKAATKISGKGRKQKVEYDSKASNYWAVKESVVEWDIPFEPTPKDLDETDTWLLKQVYGHIAELTPALETQLRAFIDDDDDEDDETDDEDRKANIEAVKANGHAGEDQEQVFVDEGGPTLHAATS